ncbi:MAG TPA: AroB-related putative sugar phosphate phospholyase (cyclizing) [Magnetospirillum sp.]|nr:AroB-related putative sugar phosphate phospholyase (cyclizing) [Magnetospirillum sp.]
MSDAMMVIQSHKGPYQVHMNAGLPAELAQGKAQFLIDRNVAALHADRLASPLASGRVLLIDATEENKSIEAMPAYIDHLAAAGIKRDHLLVAVGGGIVQDITCFLAANMFRGMDWVFAPTTLLAQCDSCIGSKSSINAGGAKNLLGTFTPSRQVFIDPGYLDTLDVREIRSGVGEMLKVHAIAGPEHFAQIAAAFEQLFTDRAVLARFIRRSLEVKQAYIEQDEFDRGIRNIFNYGHTTGHAIEAATHFGIPHGIAVAMGMDLANHIARRSGVTPDTVFQSMHPTLRRAYAGYEDFEVPLEAFFAAAAKDKKNETGGQVAFILPDAQARIVKHPLPVTDQLRAAVAEFFAEVRRD